MTTPGRFIVLEGLDGAGTTTLAGLLTEALQARDLRVQRTAEPTRGPFGRLLRRHVGNEITLEASTAALIFTADRQDHLDTLIRPALRRGEWVVSDRYLLSTLAYQGAEGVDTRKILAASASFEVPDVTFFLDVPADVRERRMAGRGAVHRYEVPEFADTLRKAYESSIAVLRAAGHRIDVVDASVGAEDVLAELLARLDAEG